MKRILLAAVALTAFPSVAGAQLVNGSFEAPVVAGPCCNTVPPDALPGWTATPNVNVVVGTFSSTNGNLAFDGNQYLDLVGQGGTGSISQDFATVIGQVYNLSFAYSHNLFNQAVTSASASYNVAGLNGVVFHNTGSNANLDWQLFSGDFTATATTTTLSFVNLTGGPNEGIFLDAVSVQAVPEPGTWAQMLLGFGVIGGTLRTARRRRALAAAA